MKINIKEIDQESFLIKSKVIAGDTCYLINPIHIGCKWTKKNLIFRSSIWNEEGNPVSLSFKKFFNWEEQPDLAYKPFSLTANGGCNLVEKIDGSTLIVSQYKGELITRTRGTFDATELDNGYEIQELKDKYWMAFNNDYVTSERFTVIYEWVSPVNKIVLNYGDKPDIYLVGIVKHEDYSLLKQKELDKVAKIFEVKRPKYFNFSSIKEMIASIEELKGEEGLCCYCNHGQDIRKVKSAWYLSCHRMKEELGSYARIVDLYFSAGLFGSYDEFYKYIHDTFDYEIAEISKGDISKVTSGMKEVQKILNHMEGFVNKLKGESRKEAAQKIVSAYGKTNRAYFAFKLLDGKEINNEDKKKLLYQVTKK